MELNPIITDEMDSETEYQSLGAQSEGSADRVLLAIGCLAKCVVLVAQLCFLVSGMIFTIEEYTKIPDCGEVYRGWSIAMLVLAVMIGAGVWVFPIRSLWRDENRIVVGLSLLIMLIVPAMVWGLGRSDVLDGVERDCDISKISQLETWSKWLIGFHQALVIFMFLFGGLCTFVRW